MEYAVDFVGFFKPGNDFVLKEYAFVPLSEDKADPVVLLFKPPFSWKKLPEAYRERNFDRELYVHGISWEAGEYDYREIGNIVRDSLRDASKVYVRNAFNETWLQRFNMKICVLSEEWSYPPVKQPKLVTVCTNHNGAYRTCCALHHVKLMRHFYLKERIMDWKDLEV